MDHITKMLERANLQSVCNFLLYSSDCDDPHKSYSERINEVEEPFFQLFSDAISKNQKSAQIEFKLLHQRCAGCIHGDWDEMWCLTDG